MNEYTRDKIELMKAMFENVPNKEQELAAIFAAAFVANLSYGISALTMASELAPEVKVLPPHVIAGFVDKIDEFYKYLNDMMEETLRLNQQ